MDKSAPNASWYHLAEVSASYQHLRVSTSPDMLGTSSFWSREPLDKGSLQAECCARRSTRVGALPDRADCPRVSRIGAGASVPVVADHWRRTLGGSGLATLAARERSVLRMGRTREGEQSPYRKSRLRRTS